VYVLYLDDSGSAKNLREDYFVLGGVCIPEGSLRWISFEIEKLAVRIEPNNPRAVEFHAAEIFSGKTYPWTRYNERKDRIDIIKSVLRILRGAYREVVTFASAVHKESFPGEDPVLLAFEDISSRFNFLLDRRGEDRGHGNHGMIVLDKTSYEDSLQNLAATCRAEGNRWGGQLRNISEVPLFVDSRASRIVQLADHIAYAVFRYYNADDMAYFNCIAGRFDENDGIIHGLSHLQRHLPKCTCPACLSRRQNALA